MRDSINDIASSEVLAQSMSAVPRLSVAVRLPPGSRAGGRGRRNEPMRFGIPLPRGLCRDPDRVIVRDVNEAAVPSQTRVLDRWSDGTVRWMLLDLLATVSADADAHLNIDLDHNTFPFEGPTLSVIERDGNIVVGTGVARFVVGPSRFPFVEVSGSSGSLLDCDRSGLQIEDERGTRYSLRVDAVSVEERGPVRSVIRLTARAVGEAPESLVDVVVRMHFVSGSGSVRFELAIVNPRAADHPGGLWDLGGSGSVWLREVSLAMTGRFAGEGRCWPEPGVSPAALGLPFEIYQDSSGGENWNSTAHVNRNRVVPVTFQGYRMTLGSEVTTGQRASPVVSMGSGQTALAVAVPGFWENFPKAITVAERTLSVALFPRQFSDVHELQGGERKAHVFVVAFGEDTVSDPPLSWVHAPMTVTIEPSWCGWAGTVAPLTVGTPVNRERYGTFIEASISGDDRFEKKRDAADEFGWRDFGDLPADHESVNARSALVSHYNNQYDAIAGFAIQYLSSGDHRWFALMNELAMHVGDIDIYHTNRDKAAYNNGLFWHTNHLTDADTATHRAYPRRAGQGGGPSAEHNYTTGFMLHYFLTGSSWSRDAVLQLAGWVIAMDDGRRTPFGWLDPGPTGIASSTVDVDDRGAGRGAGNSLNALLDAHRLTGDAAFLDKAHALVWRCIHPRDDPSTFGFLDAEKRWSYTVFLQAVGKYLAYLEDCGNTGDRWRYARASLLTYARWMRDHERPYLDHPDTLEFPNETWAAQDLRKAGVLEGAARYVEGRERQQLLDRAAFFFDGAIETLAKWPTRRLTRPLVLMLAYGYRSPFGSPEPALAAGAADLNDNWGAGRPRFVPYKQRVVRRAIALGAFCAATGLALVLWWLWK